MRELGLEKRILVDTFGKWIWWLRTFPAHAVHHLAGIVLPPHERFWIRKFFADYKENIVVASRGTSKCLAIGTKVLMANGAPRAVEDIQVGDLLLGPDGYPRRVLHTVRGQGPLYEVKQDRGITYTVNEDHILSTMVSTDNNTPPQVVNIGVREFAQLPSHIAYQFRGYKAQFLYPREKDLTSHLTVAPVGEGEWAGFTLSGDHLFLLEDGTVTHNSFSYASLAAPIKSLLYRNLRTLVLSASGFRGGQLLLDDTERLFLGQLHSQTLPDNYLQQSVTGVSKNKVVRRAVDRWTIPLTSMSSVMTIPTNNAQMMRGIRSNLAIVDERNTFDGEIVQKIIRPMLNVGLDFLRPASGGDSNQIFQISTIDYTVRDWYPEIDAMKILAKREYQAHQARKAGDWNEYERLLDAQEGALRVASFSYSSFDYTDLLIPEEVQASDGNTYKVNYPVTNNVRPEDILRYDEADKIKYWYTYPVDKDGLESPMRDGTMDRDLWLAEQRNTFINSAGSFYGPELVGKISERPIYEQGGITKESNEWFAPLMYTCGDPCVLGVDYARESDQFAIVVLRLGEIAEGKFDPNMTMVDDEGRTRLGQTPWNNVVWAESHYRWTAAEAAAKIREMYKRYNLVRTDSIRAIGMDKGGGGTAVRDELAQPRPPVLSDGNVDPNWDVKNILKIFDPEDEDYKHYSAYNNPAEYWGGLELIKPTNMDNIQWAQALKGMMQQGKLFLPFWQPPSKWAPEMGLVNSRGMEDRTHPLFQRTLAGYNGIRTLKGQLIKVQGKVSESGVIRFVMPGDRAKESGKKDLFSALIYAVHMARQHLVATTKDSEEVPMIEPLIVNIGGDRKLGRGSTGYFDNFRQSLFSY